MVWEIPTGDYPRSNATTCCNRTENYRNFLEVRGVSVDDIADLTATDSSLKTHGDVGMGISVDASLSCTVGNYLCGCLNCFANAEQELGVGRGCLNDIPNTNHLARKHCLP